MGRPRVRPGQRGDRMWYSNVEFELRRIEHFAAKTVARAKVAACIEDYNTTRPHSSLGVKIRWPTSKPWRHGSGLTMSPLLPPSGMRRCGPAL